MYRGVFYVDESAGVDYAALKKARLPRTTRQDQRAYAIGVEHMTLDDIVSEPVIVRIAADPEQVALVPIAQSRLNPTSAASPTRNSVCTTGRPISARPSSAPAGARRSAGQRHTGQRPFDRRRGNQSDPKPATRSTPSRPISTLTSASTTGSKAIRTNISTRSRWGTRSKTNEPPSCTCADWNPWEMATTRYTAASTSAQKSH